MIDISVILPTIRPEQFIRSYASVAGACLTAGTHVRWEVVIVADFPDPRTLPMVRWFHRPRAGTVDAINAGFAKALGEYIFLFNDESVLEEGALYTLFVEAEKHRARGERVLLGPKHVPAFDFRYYGRPFIPFIFCEKAILESIGGLLDPAYRNFYADPDCSLRALRAGMTLRTVENAVLHHANNMNAIGHREAIDAFLLKDRETFRARWDHLGEFKDPE